MRQWRLIYDYPTCGPQNMAVDEAMLLHVGVQPTLRLYAWNPFCLSLGYGQRAHDVDREQISKSGFDLVRRPTGGRAILHGDELTYSIILPAEHPLAAGGILPCYRRITEALLAGLQRLEVFPEAEQHAASAHGGPVCFETPSHCEVTLQGRKLVGSAQLRRGVGVLQHGSIPLSGDVGRICDVLVYPDVQGREEARDQVRARAVTLSDASGGRPVHWQAAADALVDGFQSALGIEFCVGRLTDEEQVTATQLVAEKYANPGWTFRR